MATRSIPHEEWVGFFDQFSRDHLGQTATLELAGQDVGDQTEADARVFRGISADEKDRENRISIMLGEPVDEGTEHAVIAPSEVWLKEAEGAIGDTLEIRSSDGATLLTFAPSDLPITTPAS